ncbi:helix-turn-helix domain-containing protein [Cryobacterium psychrophilum]|uniref:XRE family transcriptional regulator n=1 Tax=Cryobacterium psychrophilum TaxID=41988 RepID=A0A4Y8KJM0_9MICO|nr:helix-turn-helix transcriptional regulator [Cryobacterium psychrophilum]TDW30529.1 DNA-binding XRE family transcriptional regulator [Cryobacterium psychrophilum]TFD76304.1 XRE family transcriptional regulator [Cryobacterium psychrophilum]
MNTTRIVQLRLDHGWTQERLATAAGVGLRTIQRLEAGQEASLETLSLVASALRVSVHDLYSQIDDAVLRDRVEFFESRAAEEQSARERIEKGWRWLYVGIGVILTFVSFTLSTYGATVFFSYWIGGYMILVSVRRIYLEPRLQKDYPHSMSRQQIRARRNSARGSWRVREENATAREQASTTPPLH